MSPNVTSSPIVCAFENEEFSTDNWGCQTIKELRQIAEDEENECYAHRHNDSSIVVIPYTDKEGYTYWLIMPIYKNRNYVEDAFFLHFGKLTLTEAEKIIKYYEKRIK